MGRLYTPINYPICSHLCHENILWSVSVKAAASEQQSEVFLSLLPDTWNVFILKSISWQCRYKTNVCVRKFGFFLNNEKKTTEFEHRTDDHTQNVFATGRHTVGDPSVATCLMMICIFSQRHGKKKRKHEKKTCVCFGAAEQETQAAAFSVTYLFISLFI